MRVPHCWLDGPETASTLDLTSTGFALLVPSATDIVSRRAATDQVEAEAGLQVALHEVDEVPGIVLVRPDGVVAWSCGDTHDGPAELAGILDALLSRTAVAAPMV